MKKDVILNIDEAAALLKIPRSKVLRWVQQGQIPCKSKGDRCTFKKKEILEWAKAHNLIVFEGKPENHSADEESISLKTGIEKGGIFFDLEGEDAVSVFKKAVDAIDFPPHIDKETVLKALISREEIASTGMGRGVAIPHPRSPLPIDHSLMPVFFLKRGIDFRSVDGQSVSVLFFLFSPSTKVHLKLLSKLSFCLREPDFLGALKRCRTDKDVLRLIDEHETRLEGFKKE